MHLMCATSMVHWIRLLHRYGPIGRDAFGRAMTISVHSAAGVLTRLDHRLRFVPTLDRVEIKHPPVFIIGHWRSGTTWLHELLSRDERFGYVSMWQALAPESIFAGWYLRYLFGWAIPSTRPMDQIALDMDAPFEEEAAMAVLGDVSYYHGFYFPRHAMAHFRRAVMFEGLTDEERARWQRDFVRYLKSITKARDGRRLVLKNPANTARIRQLLELFPEARFIHIQRDPFDVFASTLRMRCRMVERLGLQCAWVADIREQVFSQYRTVMHRYFDTRGLIPAGHLVELRYEDLERDPLGQLQGIYEKLDLGDFQPARPAIEQHLNARRDYRKNTHRLDAATINRIGEEWAFAFARLGYGAGQVAVPGG